MPIGHAHPAERPNFSLQRPGLYSTNQPMSWLHNDCGLVSEVPDVAEVGILIIDDDIVSQRALKNVLDSEGWRVRIVPLASHALGEIASGVWSLVIVNVALTDVRGPIFTTLKDLAQAEPSSRMRLLKKAATEKRSRRLRPRSASASFSSYPFWRRKRLNPCSSGRGSLIRSSPTTYMSFSRKSATFWWKPGPSKRLFAAWTSPYAGAASGCSLGSRQAQRCDVRFPRGDYQMSDEEMVEFEAARKKKTERSAKNTRKTASISRQSRTVTPSPVSALQKTCKEEFVPSSFSPQKGRAVLTPSREPGRGGLHETQTPKATPFPEFSR